MDGSIAFHPFGSIMPGRNFNAGEYRYGFNGQEKDDEITGVTGSHLDFGARIYDSRLARWLSVDPERTKFPSLSPFSFAADNPVFFLDKGGRVIIAYSESAEDVEAFFGAVFTNWDVMKQYVKVTTDQHGNTVYSIDKKNFRAFVNAAGDNSDAKNAARIVGRFMRASRFKLWINARSNKNEYVPMNKYEGTAHIDPDNDEPAQRTDGTTEPSTCYQRIAHEAFGEAFYALRRGDMTLTSEDTYNQALDEVFNDKFMSSDDKINYAKEKGEPVNVEVIQYENIFNRLLDNKPRTGAEHRVRQSTIDEGKSSKPIDIPENN
ncbi:MAG: hypothetical protein KKA07_13665 [Bacteroidetes bacterium]|nr:hypothetical protein [Bacteroidota bacterium]